MNDPKLGDISYYRYPKRNCKIIDRSKMMDRITSLLKQNTDSTRVAILNGMGGQGKTILAINYCSQAKTKLLFHAIFWLDASSEETLLKGLITISDVVKGREDQLFDTSEARIRFMHQRIEEWNRPWLLIMDNYDDPGRLSNLTSYIPNSVHGSVLITSRQANLERLGSVINVPPMSKDESLLLLYDRCGAADEPDGEDEYAAKLVEMLGHLPLAIDQAGAYIRRRVGFSFSRFIREYRERKDSIWSKAPMVWDYKAPVYTTWEMSFDLIDEDKGNRDEKGRILTMLSFLDFRSISQEIFKVPRSLATSLNVNRLETPKWLHLILKGDGDWDLLKLEDLLTDFKDLSLIQLTAPGLGALQFSLHPLVSEWVKYRADPETRTQCLYEAILIVKLCLEAKLHLPTKVLLSVEAEQEVFRHQFSCMENLRTLQTEDSKLMGQSPYPEPSASSEARRRRATRMLERDVRDWSIQVQSMLSVPELQQEQAILNWLCSDDSSRIMFDLVSRTMEGTGQWFVHEIDVQNWLSSDYQMLWVVGKPGCGKSVIASQMVQLLMQTQPDAMCLFFFCNYTKEDTHLRILCALVRQASSQLSSTPMEVRSSFAQHAKSQTRPDYAEVTRLLFAVVVGRLALAKRVYIVIDALDELEKWDCRKLFEVIRQLVYAFSPSVSVMVTSRPSANLDDEFPDLKKFELATLTSDIELFLWVKSFIDELVTKRTPRAVRSFLEQKPNSLYQTYEYLLQQIRRQPAPDRDLGIWILMWLFYAIKPFQLRELQHAVSSMKLGADAGLFIEETSLVDMDLVSRVCAGLVVIDDETDAVRLNHYTVKEYLQSEKDRLIPGATNDITKSCIRYLSLKTFAAGPCPEAEIRDRVLKYPFATYAALYWVRHANQEQEALADEVVSEVARFLADRKLFDSWIQIVEYAENQASMEYGGSEEGEPPLSKMLARCSTPLEAAKEVGLDVRVLHLLDSME
ncbi:MAG: hypothetical protein Q9181_004854 [Wetmoreana brouardii]